MEKTRINLHTERKKVGIILGMFLLASFVVNLITEITVMSQLKQLSSLMQSEYTYSVIMQQSAEPDSYYQYSAGVYFILSPDARKSISADIVMQIPKTTYTGSVQWNSSAELTTSGVAISENIAISNGLNVGDSIYSKHIVTGDICEYRIEQILHAASSIRTVNGKNNNNGIIVMGYDNQYENNISHSCLIYTSRSLDDLKSQYSEMPVDIVYREDEIGTVVLETMPYFLLAIVIGVLAAITTSIFLVRGIQHNFRRQIALGFEKNDLNRAFSMETVLPGVIAFVISMILSLGVNALIGGSWFGAGFVAIIIIAELISWAATALILRSQLWRK